MKISKSSWHYRFYSATHAYVPNNLCEYFWKLLGTIILSLFFVGWILYIIFCLGYAIYVHDLKSENTSVIIGTVLWTVILVIGFCCLFYKIVHWFCARHPKVYKEKTPNLLLEWFKAKKNKYCPKIEFTEN